MSFADAHYFVNALDSIKKWFSDYSQKLKKANLASLLSTILCDKTRVIWYPLETKQDCYTIFKNLNHGKIPLTDAELVKAMLLNARNFGSASNPDIVKSEQDHYARVWDEMQKTINDDKIWSFITGGGNEKLPTRIDLIIQLVVKKESSAELAESDHKFFSYFESNLPEDPNNRKEYVESVFEKLRVAFRTIQDWYENYQIHNYIGYLLTYTKDNRINEIIKWMKTYETNEKSAFINALKNTIKDVFKGKSIDEINYEENRNEVEKLLMLFNIEELNQKHEKFNFYTDKEGWSIEHIKAQHSEIVKAEDRRVFLSSEKKSLEDLENSTNDMNIQQKISGFIPQIDNLLKSTDIDENKFIQLIAQIDKDIDGFDDSDMHRLGNLALIWKSDNSSLGNDSFYAKRGKINDWANDVNKNIPYSTVKAFQKMYSDQDYSLDPTRWKKSDFDKMFSKQKEMLGDYIK